MSPHLGGLLSYEYAYFICHKIFDGFILTKGEAAYVPNWG
jgi:hypothetical protein